MTQQDKELLLRDLSARLPYGVKFACNKNVYTAKGLDLIVTDEGDWEYAVTAKGIAPIEIDFIKPYLFPLSSMNKEQKEELKNEISKQTDILIERMKNDDCGIDCGKYHFHSLLELEWLLKNHFDYRGLIPKGLAIDATGLNIY